MLLSSRMLLRSNLLRSNLMLMLDLILGIGLTLHVHLIGVGMSQMAGCVWRLVDHIMLWVLLMIWILIRGFCSMR